MEPETSVATDHGREKEGVFAGLTGLERRVTAKEGSRAAEMAD